jgi:transcriptional regulator with XRE-family HTH domain
MTLGSSTVARRQLGRQLRALRESAGLTRVEVGATKIMSRTKLEQIEYGRVSVKPGDVRELCLLYGATPEATELLRDLSMSTNDRSFWLEYGDSFKRGFDAYLGLESVASSVQLYEPAIIHGLLQSPQYALVTDRGSVRRPLSEAVIESHVQVRMNRKRLLTERNPPLRLHVVLGEAALRIQIGDRNVMAEQVATMRNLDDLENVDVFVLPFSAGSHPGLRGGFGILEFSDQEDPSLVYVESHFGARYTDHADHVSQYRLIFDVLQSRSIPLEEFLR